MSTSSGTTGAGTAAGGAPERGAHARLKRVVQRVYDIPSFPLVIARLSEVAEDPGSSSKDLAAIMEKDQALSAKVLRLVNSAFYSLSKPVSSLRHAITLVGFNSVRSLAISVSVRGAFPGDEDPAAQAAFWDHSLTAAAAARHIAERARLPIKDDLFTAGLLHDIGVLVARRYLAAEAREADRLVVEEGLDPLDAERSAIGVEHTLLGAWLAEHWRLPQIIRAAIRDHHGAAGSDGIVADEAVDPALQQAIEIVALGNELARRLGRARIPGEPLPAGEIPPHLLAHLGDEDLSVAGAEILDRAAKAREFVAI